MSKNNFKNLCSAFILTSTFILATDSVWAINKCTVDGQISYTDLPCPEPANSRPFTQQVIPPNDPAAAKKRYLSDQTQLNKITQKKAKEEKQHHRELETTAGQIKKEEYRKYRCGQLDLERKAVRKHQSELQLKGKHRASEKALLKAKKADNRFAHYCKS